jgi:hypothetical protein
MENARGAVGGRAKRLRRKHSLKYKILDKQSNHFEDEDEETN